MSTNSMTFRPGTTLSIAVVLLRRIRRTAAVWFGLGFVAWSVVPANAQPTSFPAIVADFNQDGIPDVLLPSTTTPTATIAFGSVPYGTFSANAKAVTLPATCTGPAAGGMLVGDFNGDGFPDIAFFCGGEGGPSGVLLGNGDGTFAAAKTFGGAYSTSAVLGDFNKDGKLDIVVIGPNGSATGPQGIEFFAGNGDGTFAAPVSTDFQSGSSYSSPVAADVNGDGYPDIVVGSFSSDVAPTVNVFGNNKDGTFGVVSQGSSAPNVSSAVGAAGSSIDQSILTGNFFGSRNPDFAVPDTGSTPGVFLLQNTSSAGAFSLAAAVKTPYAALQGAMVGSFTGRGFSDLVAANGNTLAVLANDGAGNFAASYATLTMAFTSSQFTVADANGDGYTDIYTVASQNGQPQISVNLVTGSASATSQPFSLVEGMQSVSAAWAGNVNFAGSTATGTQTVNGTATATAVTSSLNPSILGASITLTATVSSAVASTPVPTGTVVFQDGTTILGTGTLGLSGTATFATSSLTTGTHQIQATYGGDSFFAGSVSAALSQVVNNSAPVAPKLTWATPVPIAYPTPLSGAQLDAAATNAAGNAVPGTYVYAPAAGTVLNPGTQKLSVTFTPTDTVTYTTATASVSLTVTAPPASVTLSGPSTAPPGTQPTISFTITNPYPVELTAIFTLTFVGSGTPSVDDPAVQFSTGGRSLTLVVPANSTTVPPIQVQSGTDAGTITVALQLNAGGVDANPAGLQPVVIEVPNAVPAVKTVSITRGTGQITVAIQAFSNTRELTQASFEFTAAPGAPKIDKPMITVPVGTLFAGWFDSTDSIQYGSTFTYTQIFNINGNAANIASVQVTLTNSVGPSTPQTAQ
jgi:Bacterial Ig-like domain (group 3)/FG-GAP-like repeat